MKWNKFNWLFRLRIGWNGFKDAVKKAVFHAFTYELRETENRNEKKMMQKNVLFV